MEKNLSESSNKKYRKYYLRRRIKKFFKIVSNSILVDADHELTPYQKKITDAAAEYGLNIQLLIPMPTE